MSASYVLLFLALVSSVSIQSASASRSLASNTAAAAPIHLRFAEKPALPVNIKSVTPPSTDLGAVPSNVSASSIRGPGTFSLRGLSSIPPLYYIAEPSATKAGCLSVVNYAGVFLHTYCGFPQNPFEYSNSYGSVSLGGLRLPIDGPYTIDLFISLKGQLAVRYPNGTVRLFGNMLPYYCLDNANRFPCDIAYDEPVVYRTPFIRSTGEDKFDALDTVPSGDLYSPPYVSLINPATLPYLNDSDLNANRGGFERIAWSLTWTAWPPGDIDDDPQALRPVVRAPLRLASGNSSSLVFFHMPINSMSFTIYANGKTYKRDALVNSALYGWAASDSGEASQNNNGGDNTNIGR